MHCFKFLGAVSALLLVSQGAFAQEIHLKYECEFESGKKGSLTCVAEGQLHHTNNPTTLDAFGTMAVECSVNDHTFGLEDDSVEFKKKGDHLIVKGEEDEAFAAIVLKDFLPAADEGDYEAALYLGKHDKIKRLEGACEISELELE